MNSVYSDQLLQFSLPAAQYCSLLEERKQMELSVWIDKLCTLLPTLYSTGYQLTELPETSQPILLSTTVSQAQYEWLRESLHEWLGGYDSFIDGQNEEMQRSDLPVLVELSELLSDIYQPIRDLLGILQDRNEEALPWAESRCKNQFIKYWGENCLAALRALHALRFSALFAEMQEAEALPTSASL